VKQTKKSRTSMKTLAGARTGVSVISDKDLRLPIVVGGGASTCDPCGTDCDSVLN
jgi:hypothetical protein